MSCRTVISGPYHFISKHSPLRLLLQPLLQLCNQQEIVVIDVHLRLDCLSSSLVRISSYPLPSENHSSNLALSTSLHYRIAPVNFSHTIAPNNAKSPRMKYARISLKRFFIGSNLVLLQDKCCMFHSNQYHDCGLAMSVHNPRILVYQDCRWMYRSSVSSSCESIRPTSSSNIRNSRTISSYSMSVNSRPSWVFSNYRIVCISSTNHDLRTCGLCRYLCNSSLRHKRGTLFSALS